MENPKPRYLSVTQFKLYEKDPEEYFQRYELGIKTPPTRPMVLGQLYSLAYEDRGYDYNKGLKDAGFTQDYVRIFESSLRGLRDISKENCEVTFLVTYEGMDLLSKMDGYLRADLHILENKFGRTWSEQEVEESDQLTFYSLVHKIKLGILPKKITLNSVNSKTGKIKSFETHRTLKQLNTLEHRIQYVIHGIKNGIWHIPNDGHRARFCPDDRWSRRAFNKQTGAKKGGVFVQG